MPKIDFHDAEAGVHSIFQFGLAEPDLDEAQRFLAAFGVEPTRAGDRIEIRAGGGDHVWATILKSETARKKLQYLSLGCYEQDYGRIRDQVEAAGGVFSNGHPAGPTGGFWFRDPFGLLVQVLVAAKTMPDAKARMDDLNVGANVRGAPARSAARKVGATRLSHVALFTPDLDRALAFYTQALGLRLADRSGDIIAFTYGRHGSDHHMLAFAAGPAPGLHHTSWDMPSVECLGLANTQLRAAGYAIHWGPGRHVLGSNYFNYTADTWGQLWENSCHIDYIEKDAPWEVANFADEDAFYLWGPDAPAEMMQFTEETAA
ncbi:glyoxalase/bleomycin resistance protein/dioxygenase superfamily protein [Roseiarcus fermentans]|uniref:Glyoxalase/bleomycin resistance protein/dioxygenase superfamily protein n=1 Tax=Roseiarcus fermentans TaxID=1473586 RepID=A0A366EKC3_9HYPH|nr:VOC family protein [Roseiarcus fermentans]RBP02867.1 glyoxalase/bleomycin resistance protein/dioxygenase superfamily protein [Roseiarcus fermentans]